MTVTDYIITCALGKEIVRVDGLDEILAEVKAQGLSLIHISSVRMIILRNLFVFRSFAPVSRHIYAEKKGSKMCIRDRWKSFIPFRYQL